jgi:hypothetical protein
MQVKNKLQDELVEEVEELDEDNLEADALEEAKKMKEAEDGSDEDEDEDEDEIEEEADLVPGDDDAATKSAAKIKQAKLNKENFKADLDALVESEATLSEGFRTKASLIFETALNAKVTEKVLELDEEFEQKLSEAVESTKEDLVEKVDSYLNYVVESWAEENRIALETGIRADIAESFMSNLKTVFENHYVTVPEGKEDLVDNLSAEVEKLKESYNAEVEKNMSLAQTANQLMRDSIIAESAKGLSVAQAEKLNSLLEGVEFEKAESFVEKVVTLKESYFKKGSTITEDVTEPTGEADDKVEVTTSTMNSYLDALKKLK